MAKKTTQPEALQSFEDLMDETEALAEKIEAGQLSLDDSIAAYEKGVTNLRACGDLLKKAEDKVMLLLERNAGFQLAELDKEAGDESQGDEEDA